MKDIVIEIPQDVKVILNMLERHNHKAYIVGGCVRDSIMLRTPHDYDICTSATPDEIMSVFNQYPQVLTGVKHGTVTIVINKTPYEITTFRIDGEYSDSRRPDSVQFTKNLEDDLKRRDFTINAMAYNSTEGLIDPFHGVEDIIQKKIRCVGSAEERFNEDALRILRAVRFAGQFRFHIEYETHKAIIDLYRNLDNIALERVNSEFCKIAVSDDFNRVLVIYYRVFCRFITELHDMVGFLQYNPYHDYDVFSHTFHAIEMCDSNDLITRLAVLFHDIGKPHCYQDGEDGIRHFKGHGKLSASLTDIIMKRLRFDNETREEVCQLVHYHDASFEVGEKYVKRWLNKIGEIQLRRLLDVRRADIKGQKQNYDRERVEEIDEFERIINKVVQEDESCFTLKKLAVNGNDIKEILGIREGREIGEWLNRILSQVIDGTIENTRDDILSWIISEKCF